mgnify:CR=1 FL=1
MTTSGRLTSRDRIMSAARNEIENKGILGLRVQEVADKAKVSVPLIYKYFGDRDGLLAEVLAAMFEEDVLEEVDRSEAAFAAIASPTIDDLVAVLVVPFHESRRAHRWQRIQIVAAAMEIAPLRDRLALVTAVIQERITAHVSSMQRRLTGGSEPVSSAALSLLVQTYGFGLVLNDLLADSAASVTKEEFTAMIRAFVEPVVSVVNTRS